MLDSPCCAGPICDFPPLLLCGALNQKISQLEISQPPTSTTDSPTPSPIPKDGSWGGFRLSPFGDKVGIIFKIRLTGWFLPSGFAHDNTSETCSSIFTWSNVLRGDGLLGRGLLLPPAMSFSRNVVKKSAVKVIQHKMIQHNHGTD